MNALNASNISSGTVPTARLGSGTASSSTFLRGDSTFQTVSSDLVDDTTPQLGGNLDVNTKNINFGDSASSSDDRLNFGASTDLSIYHDGSHSKIVDTGTGDLRILSSSFKVYNEGGSETMATFTENGAVELYYDNTKMFETASYGAGFTSNVRMNSDSNSLQIGAGQDLKFFHNGSNSFITNDTGGLYIRSDVLGLEDQTNGHSYLGAQADGAVTIRYDNSIKFQTTSTGAQIESQLTVYGAAGNAGRILIAEGGAISEIRATRNSDDNGDLRFYTEISGTRAERMKLDYSGHLTPATNNTYDLGTSSLRWRNIYTTDLQLSNEGKSNDVDGTWGDYTIQEGESDLFLINNRSGKKYKFNLTEVS